MSVRAELQYKFSDKGPNEFSELGLLPLEGIQHHKLYQDLSASTSSRQVTRCRQVLTGPSI